MEYRLKKVVKVICEGKTEFNYFKGLKKIINDRINLLPLEGNGGDYKKILSQVKKTSASGSLAIFVVLDFDRYFLEQGEKSNFLELIKYCNQQNKKGIATFVVLSNPNFDYFVVSHSNIYKNQNLTSFIKKYKYTNLDELKNDEKIFEKFNNKNDSYVIAINKMNKNYPLINNIKMNSKFEFIKPQVIVNKDNFNNSIVTSNIFQLFEMVVD